MFCFGGSILVSYMACAVGNNRPRPGTSRRHGRMDRVRNSRSEVMAFRLRSEPRMQRRQSPSRVSKSTKTSRPVQRQFASGLCNSAPTPVAMTGGQGPSAVVIAVIRTGPRPKPRRLDGKIVEISSSPRKVIHELTSNHAVSEGDSRTGR